MVGGIGTTNNYGIWSEQTLDVIDRDLKIVGTDSYYENNNRNSRSFIWGNIFLMYAYTTGTDIYPELYKDKLAKCIVDLNDYWTSGYKGKDGYATLPVVPGAAPDRYYDENGWMSLGLSEAYLKTGNQEYLESAKKALAFTLSGEDDVLGGGIYFQETFSHFQPQKNTICSAVAIISAMKLYEITKEESYLDAAKRIDSWTRNNLLDKSDNLLYDAKMVSDGSINTTKWSYNAGFMIQGWLLLYKATKDEGYLRQAEKTMSASERRWFNATTGSLNDFGYFAFTVIDAWYSFFELTGDKTYLQKAFSANNFIINNLKDSNGRYPEHWGAAIQSPVDNYDLRYLSVVAYTYMKAAVYSEKLND